MIKFCFHKYGRWSEVIESYGGSLHQVCACEKCGAVKRRVAISAMVALFHAKEVNEAIKEVQS